MSSYREYKIILKTLADATGLTRLTRHLREHSRGIRALVATYRTLAAAGGAAWRITAAGARKAGMAIAGASGAIGLFVRQAAGNNIALARAVNMFDVSAATFTQFRREVRAVSSDVGIAQREIIDALYKTGSARVPKNDAITFLRVAAKAFVADGADMSSVIQGLASVIGPFNLGFDQAAVAADKLYTIVKGGQTTFEEVGDNLNQAASVAAASGVTFDQLAAGVTRLTAATIKTPTAVNALRNIISILNKELGDGWSKTKTLQQALEDFAKGKGYSQKALIKTFGLENIGPVMAMVGKNAKAAADALAEVQASTGEGLNKAAALVDQYRHWERFSESIKNLTDRIGEIFDRVIAPVVDRISARIAKWTDTDQAFVALEKRLIRIRDVVVGIVQAAQDKDNLASIGEALRKIISGVAQSAAILAGKALAHVIPALGRLFGEAAKRGLEDVFVSAGERSMARKIVEQEMGAEMGVRFVHSTANVSKYKDRGYDKRVEAKAAEIRQLNLQAEGVEASNLVGALGGGGARIKHGVEELSAFRDDTMAAMARDIADKVEQQKREALFILQKTDEVITLSAEQMREVSGRLDTMAQQAKNQRRR
jgi:TP901 family phage tail tape measure protein